VHQRLLAIENVGRSPNPAEHRLDHPDRNAPSPRIADCDEVMRAMEAWPTMLKRT
jgi:hypothetical protein